MTRKLTSLLAAGAAALALTGTAHAAGGNYVFDGGTPRQQATVRAALNASSFNWSIVPGQVTIHIGAGQTSEAVAGEIFLDSDLLDSGRFAWGVVQHEYAHEVDFLVFDAATRAKFQTALGARSWCYEAGGSHGAQGCERFASTLAWAYWQNGDNALKPQSKTDEAAWVTPAAFKTLLGQALQARTLAASQPTK